MMNYTENQDGWVVPFQLEERDIRGRAVQLQDSLSEIFSHHDYPELVETLLAEALLLTVLIAQSIKLDGTLSLQIRGDGPVRLLATDYISDKSQTETGKIRAYASFDKEKSLPDSGAPLRALGQGYFAILISQGKKKEPFKGITSLSETSLSACAEAYFEQSEQLKTSFKLAAQKITAPDGDHIWRAGGIMVQKLPSSTDETEDAAENWRRAQTFLQTAMPAELIGPDPGAKTLLYRLFHEDGLRLYPPRPVVFGCSCSADRVRQSLSIYSQKDLTHMTKADGTVSATCQFCKRSYSFDPKTLGFEATDELGHDT